MDRIGTCCPQHWNIWPFPWTDSPSLRIPAFREGTCGPWINSLRIDWAVYGAEGIDRRGRSRRYAESFVPWKLHTRHWRCASKNYESLSEQGLGAVPWTTAVEILASPPGGHVKKWDCLRLIGQSPPAQCQELQRKTYWTKGKGRRQHLTLSQKAFFHIYEARSKFVHGDRVSRKLLLPFGKGTLPLLSIASTVYRVALISYLQEHWPWEMPAGNPILLADEMAYDHHLLRAVGKA